MSKPTKLQQAQKLKTLLLDVKREYNNATNPELKAKWGADFHRIRAKLLRKLKVVWDEAHDSEYRSSMLVVTANTAMDLLVEVKGIGIP